MTGCLWYRVICLHMSVPALHIWQCCVLVAYWGRYLTRHQGAENPQFFHKKPSPSAGFHTGLSVMPSPHDDLSFSSGWLLCELTLPLGGSKPLHQYRTYSCRARVMTEKIESTFLGDGPISFQQTVSGGMVLFLYSSIRMESSPYLSLKVSFFKTGISKEVHLIEFILCGGKS